MIYFYSRVELVKCAVGIDTAMHAIGAKSVGIDTAMQAIGAKSGVDERYNKDISCKKI